MKRALVFLCLPLILLSACSVVKVVPRPEGSTRLSDDGRYLVDSRGDITVSVRMEDTQVPSHRMVQGLSSFQVVVENGSAEEVNLPLTSFVLLDDEGNQYNAVAPTAVRDFVKDGAEYLIPYPYVGYYYTEDYARVGSANALQSSLPYYAENHPQDIFTQALPQEAIIPGAKISGLVYFVADLAGMESLEVRIYRPGTPLTSAPDFRFPFSVEKE